MYEQDPVFMDTDVLADAIKESSAEGFGCFDEKCDTFESIAVHELIIKGKFEIVVYFK